MATDATRSRHDTAPVTGEALVYHGPGWTICTDAYEVICWAPGPVTSQGRTTGEIRTDWLLSVEVRPVVSGHPGPDRQRIWESGGFVSGATLADVLAALALLDEPSRRHVTEVLTARLGRVIEAQSPRRDNR